METQQNDAEKKQTKRNKRTALFYCRLHRLIAAFNDWIEIRKDNV